MFESKAFNYKNSGIYYEEPTNDMKLPVKVTYLYFSKKDFSLTDINKHWHSTMEIIYSKVNSADVLINGKSYNVSEGDFILINPNEVHKGTVLGDFDFYEGYVLQIDNNFVEFLYPNIKNIEFSNQYILEHTEIIEIIESIISEYIGKKDVFNIYGYLFLLFSKLIKYSNIGIVSNEIENKKLKQILNFIEQHYNDCLSPYVISEEFNISYGHLAKLFKETLNTTFKEHLTEKRIEKSMEDLLYSSKTITEIAIEYGFSNTKSYIEKFRIKYNCTPNIYRNMIRK